MQTAPPYWVLLLSGKTRQTGFKTRQTGFSSFNMQTEFIAKSNRGIWVNFAAI